MRLELSFIFIEILYMEWCCYGDMKISVMMCFVMNKNVRVLEWLRVFEVEFWCRCMVLFGKLLIEGVMKLWFLKRYLMCFKI